MQALLICPAFFLQMLTGRQAWEECDSPLQVIYAVGVERRRLPIPAGCPPALGSLLKECWRHNAGLRPSFTEVLVRLRALRSQDSFRALPLKVPPAGAATGSGGGIRAAVPPSAGSIKLALPCAGDSSGRAKAALFTPAPAAAEQRSSVERRGSGRAQAAV